MSSHNREKNRPAFLRFGSELEILETPKNWALQRFGAFFYRLYHNLLTSWGSTEILEISKTKICRQERTSKICSGNFLKVKFSELYILSTR